MIMIIFIDINTYFLQWGSLYDFSQLFSFLLLGGLCFFVHLTLSLAILIILANEM